MFIYMYSYEFHRFIFVLLANLVNNFIIYFTTTFYFMVAGSLSHLDPLIKGGYGLTVTEITDFVSSLANNYDPELYS